MADNFDPQFNDETDLAGEPGVTTPNEGSPLAGLMEELSRKVENPDLEVPVRGRPVTLIMDTNIDGESFQAWQRRCMGKGGIQKGDFNTLRFSCIIIASQTKAVKFSGKYVHGEDGSDLNFKNPEFRQMLNPNSQSQVELVRALFSNDGSLINAATEVLEAAGYGDDTDELMKDDPTNP